MKCSPATQSSHSMIEIDKVSCMDIGVYVFYMCLYVYIYISIYLYIYIYIYVYIGMYYWLLCTLVDTYIYLHIPYRGLIGLYFVF